MNEDLKPVVLVSQGEVKYLSGRWWLKMGYLNDPQDKELTYTVLCFNYKREAERNFVGTTIYV